MKIVVVMSESFLWKSQFLNSLIEKLPEDKKIVGVVLTKFIPSKTTYSQHISRYITILGPWIFLRMVCFEIYHRLADSIDRIYRLPKAHSIASVCRRQKIPVCYSKDVNCSEAISWIKQFDPDIILCSGNQILKKEVLKLARIGCLNRHSSLLPSYRGIYPVFWCLLNEEKEVGVSIHLMTQVIDQGAVVAQRAISVEPQDTFFSLFEKCFKMSPDVVIEALENVTKQPLKEVKTEKQTSYFSYPSRADVRRFRQKGKRIL